MSHLTCVVPEVGFDEATKVSSTIATAPYSVKVARA